MWKLALAVALLLAHASASSECVFASFDDITRDCTDATVILEDVTISQPFDCNWLDSLTLHGGNVTITATWNKLPAKSFVSTGVTYVCQLEDPIFIVVHPMDTVLFESCSFINCDWSNVNSQFIEFKNNTFE